MPQPTPRAVVSDKCIEFSIVILQEKRGSVSDREAEERGKELFDWLEGAGALTEDKAAIAARCVDFGIALLRDPRSTVPSAVEAVQRKFSHYA